jgi:hypothetical protein
MERNKGQGRAASGDSGVIDSIDRGSAKSAIERSVVSHLVLAQAAPLPDPALLPKLLFEEPLLLTGILIVAAVGAFFFLNSQGKVKRAAIVGGIGLLIAGAVQVLAFSVETAREKIIAATTPLVDATAAADTARLDPMLHDSVKLTNDRGLTAGGGELPTGGTWDKAQILSQVRSQLGDKWRLKEATVLDVQGVIDLPGQGRTQVRVRATLDAWSVPFTSVWRIEWREDSRGGWQVTGIEPVDLGFSTTRRR